MIIGTGNLRIQIAGRVRLLRNGYSSHCIGAEIVSILRSILCSAKVIWHIFCALSRRGFVVIKFTSLKTRLLGGSAAVLIVLLGIYTSYTVWHHETHLMQLVEGSAVRISEFIKSSTHYSMLQNRKEDVYRAMRTIGTQEGVEGIRIYNKRGVITFSTAEEERGEMTDLRAESCVACHSADKPLASLPSSNRIRIYDGPNGRVMGLINPIRNEESCASSECHEPPDQKTILGVLDVRMSLAQIDANIARERLLHVLYAVLVIVSIVVVAWMMIRRTVLLPINALMEGTRQVSDGNMSYEVDSSSPTELGELARSFNLMTSAVRSAQEKIQEWSDTLEKRVAEKTEELTIMHRNIVNVEKMASLGRLSATVAHELNNPLEAILTYTKLLKRQGKKREDRSTSVEEREEVLDIIGRETQRCGDIVKNLLLFSKKESGEFVYESLEEVLNRAYALMKHHLDMRDVTYKLMLPDHPIHLLCDPQQVQQALVALYVNAADAMSEGGTLTVHVRPDTYASTAVVDITDTGVGIAEADVPRVFEPFFTTKSAAQGVGLGLSVVYGIMQRHNGSVTVRSKKNEGTTISLSFPLVNRDMADALHHTLQKETERS